MAYLLGCVLWEDYLPQTYLLLCGTGFKYREFVLRFLGFFFPLHKAKFKWTLKLSNFDCFGHDTEIRKSKIQTLALSPSLAQKKEKL